MVSNDKNNLYSMIDIYILNEGVIATKKGLLNYNPVFKKMLDGLKIKDEKINSVILTYYLSRIEEYVKKTEKFPYKENLMKFSSDYEIIFWCFTWTFESKFWDLMLHYFWKIVNANSQTKSKSVVKDKYLENKELFKDFFILNLDRDNIKGEEFHSLGTEVKNIIQEAENFVVWRMEGGKYWVFSSSTRDKFIKYVKLLFPLFDHIGVKVRYI